MTSSGHPSGLVSHTGDFQWQAFLNVTAGELRIIMAAFHLAHLIKIVSSYFRKGHEIEINKLTDKEKLLYI